MLVLSLQKQREGDRGNTWEEREGEREQRVRMTEVDQGNRE